MERDARTESPCPQPPAPVGPPKVDGASRPHVVKPGGPRAVQFGSAAPPQGQRIGTGPLSRHGALSPQPIPKRVHRRARVRALPSHPKGSLLCETKRAG